jgi:hypothetical protein
MTTTPRSPVRRALANATVRTSASRRIRAPDEANARLVASQREALAARKRIDRARGRMANRKLAAAPARPDQGGYVPAPYTPGPSDVVVCPVCSKLNGLDACACDQCAAILEGRDDVVASDGTALSKRTRR